MRKGRNWRGDSEETGAEPSEELFLCAAASSHGTSVAAEQQREEREEHLCSG